MEENLKQLLLKDLCARLLHGIKVLISGEKYFGDEKESYIEELVPGSYLFDSDVILKPYLRPMSSMTEEERAEFYKVGGLMSHKVETNTYILTAFSPEAYDWLNAHHFDYRGLIEKGLAIEAPDGMYNSKKK